MTEKENLTQLNDNFYEEFNQKLREIFESWEKRRVANFTERDFTIFGIGFYEKFTKLDWEVFYRTQKPPYMDIYFDEYIDGEWISYKLLSTGELEIISKREKINGTYVIGRIDTNEDKKQRKKDYKQFLNKKYDRGKKWKLKHVKNMY